MNSSASRILELLAPAKNIDIGIAAVNCGADALYIAGPAFGAREAAGNSFNDIETLVRYAHKFGVKVYITLNTILYDHEMETASKIAKEAFNIGCDALIIQDLGLLKIPLPPIPLIASTQTNIRTVEQALFLESLGFKRLILARELSLKQIKEIRTAVSLELEVFIHGSLCVSYSGQCYISEKITGRSANRGICAQICRNRFDLIDSSGSILLKNSPILSLKDLNLSTLLPMLVESGISSFKIEGRLKNQSYVKNVVRFYRKLIDGYISKRGREDLDCFVKSSYGHLYGGFTPVPEYSFNRGYTDLFLLGKRGAWMSESGSKYIGDFMGSVIRCESGGSCIGIDYRSNDRFNNGDGCCFIFPNGESVGARVNSVNSRGISIFSTVLIPIGSKVYRSYNHVFERELVSNMPKRMLRVSLYCRSVDDEFSISAVCENNIVANISEPICEEAKADRERAIETIRRQLSKDTDIYRFEVVKMDMEKLPFYTLSQLNGFRRLLASKLNNKIETDLHLFTREFPDDSTLDPGSALRVPYSDYRLNVSNRLSKTLYFEKRLSVQEPAYEISHKEGVELMRCKYCIKFEIGICPKLQSSSANYKEPLSLVNNGYRLPLLFDCAKCEMVIMDK